MTVGGAIRSCASLSTVALLASLAILAGVALTIVPSAHAGKGSRETFEHAPERPESISWECPGVCHQFYEADGWEVAVPDKEYGHIFYTDPCWSREQVYGYDVAFHFFPLPMYCEHPQPFWQEHEWSIWEAWDMGNGEENIDEMGLILSGKYAAERGGKQLEVWALGPFEKYDSITATRHGVLNNVMGIAQRLFYGNKYFCLFNKGLVGPVSENLAEFCKPQRMFGLEGKLYEKEY